MRIPVAKTEEICCTWLTKMRPRRIRDPVVRVVWLADGQFLLD